MLIHFGLVIIAPSKMNFIQQHVKCVVHPTMYVFLLHIVLFHAFLHDGERKKQKQKKNNKKHIFMCTCHTKHTKKRFLFRRIAEISGNFMKNKITNQLFDVNCLFCLCTFFQNSRNNVFLLHCC